MKPVLFFYRPSTERKSVFFFKTLRTTNKINPVKKRTAQPNSNINLPFKNRSPTTSNKVKTDISPNQLEYSLFRTVLKEKGKFGGVQRLNFGKKNGV
jgi:hypothetical protein